jgi:hypothetical protein
MLFNNSNLLYHQGRIEYLLLIITIITSLKIMVKKNQTSINLTHNTNNLYLVSLLKIYYLANTRNETCVT